MPTLCRSWLPTLSVLLCWATPAVALESTPLTGITTIATGGNHACAVAQDQLWCWGWNSLGQLGLGHQEPRSLATPVPGLPATPTDLALGAEHSCAIVSGEAWCWGGNSWGQLGTGDRVDRLRPTRIRFPLEVAKIVAGRVHSCAKLINAEVYCWGNNQHGQLGLAPAPVTPGEPFAAAVPTPVRVNPGLIARSLALGSRHSCAANDRTVHCWGDNSVGQLGDGSTVNRHQPAAVLDMEGGVRQLYTLADTTCALIDGERIRCWGNNYAGQAGVEPQAGGVDAFLTRATPVTGLPSGLYVMAMGFASSCVQTVSPGAVYCWGYHPADQTRRSARPFEVQRYPTPVSDVALLGNAVCVRSLGQLLCLGQPSAQGRGEAIDNLSGLKVAGLPERSDRDQLKLGAGFGCVRDHQRVLHCFGDNRQGQLGRGHTEARSGAAPVALAGVRDWAAGVDHACAVTDAGTFCWGSNASGQLGDGSQTARSSPVRVGLTAARAKITTGDAFTCNFEPGARSVWCWGSNRHGQLGVAPIGTQNGTLQEISLPGPVLDVQAGRRHVCALLDDPLRKRVHCWGWIPTQSGEVPFSNLMSTLPREIPADVLGFEPLALVTSAFTFCVRGASGQRCFGQDWSYRVETPRGRERAGVAVSPPDLPPPADGFPPVLPGGRHLCSVGADALIRCIGLPSRACTYEHTLGLIITPGQSIGCSYGEILMPAWERDWLPVRGLPRALPQQLAAGDQHACAEIDGELYCWGVGNDLALGSPKSVVYTEPLPILRAGAREPTRLQPVSVDPARACPGYYVGSVSLRQPMDPDAAGAWGLELLLGSGNRLLQGGLNFGGYGSADVNPPVPGYAAFRIGSADGRGQRVTLTMRGDGGQFRLRVLSTVPPSTVRQTVSEQTVALVDAAVERSLTLADGFHIVELQPLSGERLFLVTAGTTTLDGGPAAFRDGAVVGGYLRADRSGFAAVCTSDNQSLPVRTEARSTRGPEGAGDLRLRILDAQTHQVLHDSLNP